MSIQSTSAFLLRTLLSLDTFSSLFWHFIKEVLDRTKFAKFVHLLNSGSELNNIFDLFHLVHPSLINLLLLLSYSHSLYSLSRWRCILTASPNQRIFSLSQSAPLSLRPRNLQLVTSRWRNIPISVLSTFFQTQLVQLFWQLYSLLGLLSISPFIISLVNIL
jgi:hypothetical protein